MEQTTYYQRNKVRVKEKRREWRENNRESVRAQGRASYYRHREKRLVYRKLYYEAHRAEIINKQHKRDQAQKLFLITHYGGGKAQCVRCSFDDLRALSIDHLDGQGYNQRKVTGIGQKIGFYDWLQRNNLPKNFQTLCMNCQFIMRWERRRC